MMHFFVPYGEIFFNGNKQQLNQTIRKLGGVRMEGKQFRCKICWPKRSVFSLNIMGFRHLHFVFHCHDTQIRSKFQISYQVYPSFSSTVAFLFPFLVIFAGLFQYMAGKYEPHFFIVFLPLSVIPFLLFFIARKKCIQQFIDAFMNQ